MCTLATQVAVHPYSVHADNRFETACIAALMLEYFASVLAGVAAPSAALDVTVIFLRASFVAFAVYRSVRTKCSYLSSDAGPDRDRDVDHGIAISCSTPLALRTRMGRLGDALLGEAAGGTTDSA
jgi:hypothetical protein